MVAASGIENPRATLLHAFSGCDTVSVFCGISKKTVWGGWQSSPKYNAFSG